MPIIKVWIDAGCTLGGLCEGTCPELFAIPDEAQVKVGVDFSAYEDCIKEAAKVSAYFRIRYCP